MFRIMPTRQLAALAVAAGLLVAAAPAGAGTFVGNPGDRDAQRLQSQQRICAFPDVCNTARAGFWLGSNDALGILYNGHAGLGSVALNVPDVTVIPN